MDKRAVKADMKTFTGGASFMNKSEIARYLRIGRSSVSDLVMGLEGYRSGREVKFFIDDIAERICSR